ncbi:DUF6931 family protein [Morganella psychrotolerans]|uniref:DUF6931 family protein n=1 Tax=Morganella psychrotolerans TaxID=368603 RepID=UPI0039AF3882
MLRKIPYSSVMQVMKNYTPSDAAIALAKAHPAPADFLSAAQQQKCYADAVLFLAHGLPLKEALWWGYCCAQSLTEWTTADRIVLETVKAWLSRSGEVQRRSAGDAAQLQGQGSAAGWLAQAVFWSTGSMLDAAQQPLAAPPFLYAQALSGAVNLMAVLPDGAQAAVRYPHFISLGVKIARGESV